MSALAAAGVEAGGSLLSTAANVYLANKAQKFSERMSNTAHQREVKDLRAAGLNPILSAGGSGATAPTGVVTTTENPARGLTQNLISSSNLALQKEEIKSRIDNTNQDTDKKYLEQEAIREGIKKMKWDNATTAFELYKSGRMSEAEVQNAIEQAKLTEQSRVTSAKQADLIKFQLEKAKKLLPAETARAISDQNIAKWNESDAEFKALQAKAKGMGYTTPEGRALNGFIDRLIEIWHGTNNAIPQGQSHGETYENRTYTDPRTGQEHRTSTHKRTFGKGGR